MSQTTNDSIITIEFQPVAIIIGPFQRFFNKIVGGSYPLFLAAILAMIWANLLAASYHSFWHTQLSLSFGQFTISKSLTHWIDEALMTFFFFTVFISGLSFTSAQVLDFSKLGIIAGSVVSGIAGWIVLGFLGRSSQTPAFDKRIAPGERL